MATLLAAHPLLRRVWNLVFPVRNNPNGSPNGSAKPTPQMADARLNQRASFDYAFAILFLVALHGFSALKVFVILYANYCVATKLPRKHVPWATWVFNICILFANELSDGYKFREMARLVSGTPAADLVSDPGVLIQLGTWMDKHSGIMARWEILFNITILRLISFNLDRYWSYDRGSSSPIEVISPAPPVSLRRMFHIG